LDEIVSYTLQEYLQLPDIEGTWQIEPYLPVGGSLLLHGAPKCGKSYLAMQLAVAVATGQSWMGQDTKPGRVLYLQLDTPRSLWRHRLEVLAATSAMTLPDTLLADGQLPNLTLVDKLSAPYPFNILHDRHLHMLVRLVRERQPQVVIVDTLREWFRGDENNPDLMQQVMSLTSLASRPAAVVYLHHARKTPADGMGAGDLVIDASRGSTQMPGGVDTIMNLSSRQKKDATIEGVLRIKGRACADERRKLHQMAPAMLWYPEQTEADQYRTVLHAVLGDASYTSDADRARTLADTFNKSLAAVKMDISRARQR